MGSEVFIPKLGQTVEEVTLVRWLAEDGAAVQPGDEILEVETDKANFTIEANRAGILHVGPFKAGDVLQVLAVVARIGSATETFSAEDRETSASYSQEVISSAGLAASGAGAADFARAAAASEAKSPGGTSPAGQRVFASPRARRLAAQSRVDLSQVPASGAGGQRVVAGDVQAFLKNRAQGGPAPRATPLAQRMAAAAGVDLAALSGSGPGGRITKADVHAAQAAPPADEDVVERIPLRGVRGLIAQRMAASAANTAAVTLFMEADATELVALRARLKARVAEAWGFAPGYNELLATIVAAALGRFPLLNARLVDDTIEVLAAINLGMAVDTPRGLLVPVLRHADRLRLRELGQTLRDLIARTQAGRALPDELSGATFTITNLGMYDVLAFTPIINPPQTAILGVGRIGPVLALRDGQVVERQSLMLSLTFDHRIVDGAPAARFLQYVKDLIEEPYLLLG